MNLPSYLSRLTFASGKRLPVILQTEASECGLVCLAMVLSYHGHHVDMLTLRRDFAVSLRGLTLKHLVTLATALNLSTRPLRLDLQELADLTTPCILHWNFNHFVVLKQVLRSRTGAVTGLVIHDPARGDIKVGVDEVSKRFTGVALELTPTAKFQPKNDKRQVRVREMMGKVTGLKRSLMQILLLALALEVFTLASPFYMQWVVDGAILAADQGLLNVLTLGFGLLMLIQMAIGLARSWAVIYMATILNVQWVANVFTHMLRLPVSYFEKRHLGDVASRFGAVGAIQQTLTTSFIEAIIDGLLAVATLAVMLFYSVKLSLIVFGSLLLYGVLRWVSYAPLRRATEEQIVLQAREQTIFLESIRAIQSLKLFNREDERRSRWLNSTVDAMNRGITTQKMNLGFTTANGLVSGVENLLIVWLGARMVMGNEFSIGMLYAFVSYKSTFSGRVSSLINKYVELKMLSMQGERLGDIVLTPTEEEERRVITIDDSVAVFDSDPIDGFAHNYSSSLVEEGGIEIELKNVSFRYSEADSWVVDNVSFSIAAGESVAFIGPSGCGKTTMIKLLTGLLPVSRGDILIGGRSMRHIRLQDYRDLIGVVMQDDQLLAGSLADNICFFDYSPDHDWIEECARQAAIHEDIQAMPMAYRTLVGDMGSTLSGGQKQRILLARALYKRPKILFLDEATSHLDIAKESQISRAVNNLRMTRVIVAHRPETIQTADRVIAFGQLEHAA